MRFSTVAAAMCFCLLSTAGALTAPPSARGADVPGAAASAAAAPAAVAPPPASKTPPAPPPPSADAAAKHAKRTACLKDAKTKKLVGADKAAFLKNCIAPP